MRHKQLQSRGRKPADLGRDSGTATNVMREFTWLSVGIGVVVGAALAAANAYVGLKVGMSVNASIPSAVMAILIMRAMSRRDTLLECNLVQTIGSAGQSLAAGMVFTIPALFLLGYDPSLSEMVIWGSIGGLLGVCFMVPLRRVLIVREHATLPFPEGIACAEVLRSGERGSGAAWCVIRGAVVGAGFRLLTGLGFFPETAVTPTLSMIRTQASLAAEPALLGVGYILGLRVAATMLAGAVLAWFVIIPAIAFFGGTADAALFPAIGQRIAEMTPADIHAKYVKYLGAGAVTVAGMISLAKSAPTIVSSFWEVAVGVFRTGRGRGERTDRDVPMIVFLLVIVALGAAMWRLPQVRVDHIGALAVLVFGFFFVTVASRIVGIIGASSNPASGMTIAALLATCVAFRSFASPAGVDPLMMKVACLSVGAIICSAICIAGDISQDLKTGYLVGATPWKQQIGEVIGILTSVGVIAGVILLLSKTPGFVESPEHPHPLPAPQANIMRILVDGVLEGNLPWALLIMGGAIAVVLELLGVTALPFAVGFYLPLSLTAALFCGGVVRRVTRAPKEAPREDDPGILTASGLVAGNGLMGIALVGAITFISWALADPRWINPLSGREEPVAPTHLVPWIWSWFGPGAARWGLSAAWWHGCAVVPFAALTLWLGRSAQPPPLPRGAERDRGGSGPGGYSSTEPKSSGSQAPHTTQPDRRESDPS